MPLTPVDLRPIKSTSIEQDLIPTRFHALSVDSRTFWLLTITAPLRQTSAKKMERRVRKPAALDLAVHQEANFVNHPGQGERAESFAWIRRRAIAAEFEVNGVDASSQVKFASDGGACARSERRRNAVEGRELSLA